MAQLFSAASIRVILRNPFYCGLVAEYEHPPLDMSDNLENPDKRPPQTRPNRFKPAQLFQGQHQAIYSSETWHDLQARRKQKSHTPASVSRPRRVYPLTGVAKCWVCWQYDKQEEGLRGVTNTQGKAGYRCSALQDHYKHKYQSLPEMVRSSSPGPFPKVRRTFVPAEILSRHKSWLDQAILSQQLQRLLSRLRLPDEWRATVQAYYLSEDGLAEFERASYNQRQQLLRAQTLFEQGLIDKVELERRLRAFEHEAQTLNPATTAEALLLRPYLDDFGAMWLQLSPEEQRGLLAIMFNSLYVDADARIRRVVAYSPFDQLLQLPEDGLVDL